MDENAERLANPKWTPAPSQVSFADGYPILITNTASLTALNNHITSTDGNAIGMDRFRPNIVIESDTPWAEDNWQSMQIGDVILDLVKPCARCIITSIDQSTGENTKKPPSPPSKTYTQVQTPKTPVYFLAGTWLQEQWGKLVLMIQSKYKPKLKFARGEELL